MHEQIVVRSLTSLADFHTDPANSDPFYSLAPLAAGIHGMRDEHLDGIHGFMNFDARGAGARRGDENGRKIIEFPMFVSDLFLMPRLRRTFDFVRC